MQRFASSGSERKEIRHIHLTMYECKMVRHLSRTIESCKWKINVLGGKVVKAKILCQEVTPVDRDPIVCVYLFLYTYINTCMYLCTIGHNMHTE